MLAGEGSRSRRKQHQELKESEGPSTRCELVFSDGFGARGVLGAPRALCCVLTSYPRLARRPGRGETDSGRIRRTPAAPAHGRATIGGRMVGPTHDARSLSASAGCKTRRGPSAWRPEERGVGKEPGQSAEPEWWAGQPRVHRAGLSREVPACGSPSRPQHLKLHPPLGEATVSQGRGVASGGNATFLNNILWVLKSGNRKGGRKWEGEEESTGCKGSTVPCRCRLCPPSTLSHEVQARDAQGAVITQGEDRGGQPRGPHCLPATALRGFSQKHHLFS